MTIDHPLVGRRRFIGSIYKRWFRNRVYTPLIYLPGEDVYHGVYPVFLISVCEGHHLDPIGEERPVEETVQQQHLPLDKHTSVIYLIECVEPMQIFTEPAPRPVQSISCDVR